MNLHGSSATILKFPNNFSKNTQNIDGFHPNLIKNSKILTPDPTKYEKHKEGSNQFGFTDDVLEIHGNADFIRCSEDCELNFYFHKIDKIDKKN